MERYDPSKNVCDTQDDFNIALKKAVKYTEKDMIEKAKPAIYVYLIIWTMLAFWGVILAMKIADKDTRVIHLVFALIAPPVYIISRYLADYQS